MPRGGANEQQVGHIRGRDEQHEQGGTQHDVQRFRSPVRCRDDLDGQRHDVHPAATIPLGGRSQVAHLGRHLRLGGSDRSVAAKSSHAQQHRERRLRRELM